MIIYHVTRGHLCARKKQLALVHDVPYLSVQPNCHNIVFKTIRDKVQPSANSLELGKSQVTIIMKGVGQKLVLFHDYFLLWAL